MLTKFMDGLEGANLEAALSFRITPVLATYMPRKNLERPATFKRVMESFRRNDLEIDRDKKIFFPQGTKGLGDIIADASLMVLRVKSHRIDQSWECRFGKA
ncbi:hypothetical protein [Massilia aquatica]|uniref:Uncharacterized protein n=1 Tax=Massilia aquatica TaxID=2609000 RepID=A0ABX0M1S5_9BURK|nr:hypothetical protein [Massilia aquatica]NHZ41099.1 hypothetical protein [Massilia aquatica]